MKKLTFIITLVIIVATSGCNLGSSHQSIKITNTQSKYSFEAKFPERKTKKVMNYIEETLDNNNLFTSSQDVRNTEIKLPDSTRFHLEVSPGEIEITFRKADNSFTSYRKMEKMCNGIKQVLR